MNTYLIQTLGCKVNQYESQQIAEVLSQRNLVPISNHQQPDLIVINTCCVTHIASAKSRQQIRKLQKNYPLSKIIVTGCLPAGPDSEFPDIDDILIAKDKSSLPDILGRLIDKSSQSHSHISLSKSPINIEIKDKNSKFSNMNSPNTATATLDQQQGLPILSRFSGQCRAFLKVQDGCDAYCTYCIIPKIRTNVCNKDVKTVLKEAENLVAAGHKEIVLTGIFLGAYGQKTARRKKWDLSCLDALADLVDKVAAINGLERLRLSSLEPLDVTDQLLDVMTDHHNIMPHLHLPLQSGSANVLRKMARQYTIGDYMSVIEKVKSAFDRPAITTDVIVGYPGETETDFNATLDVAKEIEFAKIHVFSFSARKNTPAEKMAKIFGKVPPEEIKRRSNALQMLDDQLQNQYRKTCQGLRENVLIESLDPLQGRCTRYFMVDLRDHPQADQLSIGQNIELFL